MTAFHTATIGGQRQSTHAIRDARDLADGFSGLPPGVTRWRLAAAIRTAGHQLGLTSTMLRLLEHYIDLTFDADWQPGSEPIITRPLIEIAEHLGRSERQIRNLEHALMARGLLVWRDSGNHRRLGRRDRETGKLLFGYGPSLAPLGARANEILDIARTVREELGLRRHIRLDISALRRSLKADLDAAEAAGLPVQDIADKLAHLPLRDRAGTPLSTLKDWYRKLQSLSSTIHQRLATVPIIETPSDTAALAETECRPDTDTLKSHVISTTKGKTLQHKPMHNTNSRDRRKNNAISLNLALNAATPSFLTELPDTHAPNWSDFIEAGRQCAISLGIGQDDWGNACIIMGREAAALSTIVVDVGTRRKPKDGLQPIHAPISYFRALTARARRGELRLDRSIRAIARRANTLDYCGGALNKKLGNDTLPRRSSGPS